MFHFRKLKVLNLRLKPSQAALLEYLYSTRSLQFSGAENMCGNNPVFLHDLLVKAQAQAQAQARHVDNTKRSISHYLRYHPINEFEPFFESVGLTPPEYTPLLPRDMIYLNEDVLLMDNYHTLCNYGVPRTKMGNIFKLVPQVFPYQPRVLISKLQSYEDLGITLIALATVVASSPCIFLGETDLDFVKVVEKLKGICGKDGDWIGVNLLNQGCCRYCNWGLVFHVLCLLSRVYDEEELVGLIVRRPCLIFKESGGSVLSPHCFFGQVWLVFKN